MNTDHRYCPSKAFPLYPFVPGVNPHPKKVGGHMEGQGDPQCEMLNVHESQRSECLCYALDLFNFGYFWESHVYFEALWHAHGRVGSVADFLKGMIKIGAAGVKLSIHQPQNCVEHLERAKELFLSVIQKEGANFLGFDLNHLVAQINVTLKGDIKMFQVHPNWPA